MKFLCIECDDVMSFAERQLPGDGTLAAVFTCGSCGREIAMLTNPMETQLVSSLGIRIGGREVPEQPMELVRSNLADGNEDAFEATPGSAGGRPDDVEPALAGDIPRPSAPVSEGRGPRPTWGPEALDRLERVPRFVRGMVKRIYTEYAQENGIETMTPELMDRARTDLGLEGM